MDGGDGRRKSGRHAGHDPQQRLGLCVSWGPVRLEAGLWWDLGDFWRFELERCDPGGQRRGARKCIFYLSLPYPSPSALSDFGVVSLLLLAEVINFKSANQHFRKHLNFVFLVLLL